MFWGKFFEKRCLSCCMRIESEALQHWMDHFYGYGSWEARTWFVGYEEGGGDLPEEVAEKLSYFSGTHPAPNPTLCDIRALYRQVSFRVEGPRADLFTNLYEYRFHEHANLHGSWKNLIAFAHSYRDEKNPDLLTYQKESFLSPAAHREALIQLYPLPSTHNHAWYYSWLDLPSQFGFLKSRAAYESHVYPDRITMILRQLGTHKPDVVVMYGMNNINALKQSVQEFFPEAKFKLVKAVKQHIPQHHRADINGTTLLLTTQLPNLRHNRIETGFDWQAFGELAR